MKNCWSLIKISLAISLLVLPATTSASLNYPKLANYYLSFFNARQYQSLARWDLLVLQPEMAQEQAPFFSYYKEYQPAGLVLAYTYPAFFYRQAFFYDSWKQRTNIFEQINNNHWWLTDQEGKIAEPWPLISAVNLTNDDWRQFNLNYLEKNYQIANKWDGIFFDLVDAYANYYQPSGIDIDQDGYNDSAFKVNTAWREAMTKFLTESRAKWPTKIIVINGNDWGTYQPPINGRMFESWPTPWQGAGTWADSMKAYLTKLPVLNQSPQVYLLNGAYNPVDKRGVYEQMRFGLTSTMLGDGYWSFDAGEGSHHELWWFDEYSLDLGSATNKAYNLLAPGNLDVKEGVWRRDFANGLVLVNSTSKAQNISLPGNKFRRFRGWQDPITNSGEVVNSLTLCPKTGIILLKVAASDPELTGDYLSCYDYQSAHKSPDSLWQKIKKGFDRLIIKTNNWFRYYYEKKY